MVKSMTGFGRAEQSGNGSTVTVEVHSVNGRFLDVRLKLPKALYEYESELRKIAQDYIRRGKVFITINCNRVAGRAESIGIDFGVADKYVELSREIAERYDIDNNMDAKTLMTFSDVIIGNQEDIGDGELWDLAKKVVQSALEIHTAMREDEGVAIGRDIKVRLDTINEYLNRIEKQTPEIIEINKERLRKRIDTLIGNDTVDEIRLGMELALYADRVDVTEECVRFRSHNKQFAREFAHESASGKKLVFLLQEMNREANTIGSKIMDADIAQLVVQIKEELEKMREQAENME
ncbi:MAG: YicC family protein [Candidatus Latescibacteria bacterium]|nr:YicC family protein [Candidatus Latescibacterota bacterium]